MNRISSYRLLTLGPVVRGLCLMTAGLALVACGGGKSVSSNQSTYTVGGSISGLTAGSVVLVNNGSTAVTVSAGATSWVFPTAFAAGSSFSVTVATQPAGELCEVTSGGLGTTLASDVGTVTVLCSAYGQWTWESGLNTVNARGVYGTQSAAAASNVPGARYDSSSWTDATGNLWLFGGVGYDAADGLGILNDLWRYSPSTGQWTWVSGANGQDASGVYGTQDTAAPGNVPGARQAASSWIDASGNLWLFGGYGYDSTGGVGYLEDLWRYSPSSGQWTWVSGGNGDNASGVYGAQGNAAAGNVPGARYSASSWIDTSGNLWLFGGYGYDSTGGVGTLDDLWQFSPSTGQWTWVSGGNGENASGVYGIRGTAATGNVPGARQSLSSWTDASGNLWLFGGYGYDSAGSVGKLNDLWRYSPSSGQWTWVDGSNVDDASGVYGTEGTASAGSVPGARQSTSSWIDSSGNLWLFGGVGYAATGGVGYLNDLWKYSPSSGEWTWVNGSNGQDASGVYGSQGTVSASIQPGARQPASSWIDPFGNLWLFGGVGYASTGNGYLNDLWQFAPP